MSIRVPPSLAGTLALGLLFVGAGCNGSDGTQRCHLLLVSIDTLRADAVDPGSPRRALTPTLDEIATGGRRFSDTWSHVPLTLPSHATLFTGRLPPELGLHDNAPFPLRGDVETLATRLHAEGFATDAVIGGQPLGAGCGLERGFERYDAPLPSAAGSSLFGERDAAAVTDRALAAWHRPVGERSRFLFVHYFDPHHPYSPPADCLRGDPADPAARYRGEVTWVDRQLARLLTAIRSSGERCVVVITSDHGEGLGDCGESTHGFQLLPATLRVPLLIAEIAGSSTAAPAALASVASDRRIGLVDLFPTTLRLLGFAPPTDLAGAALQSGPPTTPALYVEALAAALQFGWAQQSGVRGDGAFLLQLGADPPASAGALALAPTGSDGERWLLDAGASAPDDATRLEWRAAYDAARTRKLPAPTEAATQPTFSTLGYLPSSADRDRHRLLPLAENATRPSPLARRERIEQLLAAVALLDAGEPLVAVARFTALLEADPELIAARFFRARARLELEERDPGRRGVAAREAVADLNGVVAGHPDYPGAELLLVKAQTLAGDFDAARTLLASIAARGERADVEFLYGSFLLQSQSGGRQNPFFDPQAGFGRLLRSLELDREQPALRRKVEQQLLALARARDAPPWVAAALERFRR